MILQKRNSGRQWCWGCSAFGVLAPVAIERPARVRSAKAVSAILHSVLIVRLIYDDVVEREHGDCHYKIALCKYSFGKGFCSVPVLATLFNWIFLSVLNTLKSVAGNYQRAEARKWKGGKMELRTLLEKHQLIKIKKTFLAINAVFIRLKRNRKTYVLFFEGLTIHFYAIVITIYQITLNKIYMTCLEHNLNLKGILTPRISKDI